MNTFLIHLLNAIFTLKLMDQLQNKIENLIGVNTTHNHTTQKTLIWRPQKKISLDELGTRNEYCIYIYTQ